jgi:hypothetical protein
MTKEEKKQLKIDIKFLKEMHGHSQKLLDRFDIVSLEYLNQMIEDWKDELEKKLKSNPLPIKGE